MAGHHESGGRNGGPAGQSRSAAGRLIADRAHEELRDLIVTLKLAPGALLREDDLMARLGVGRTPLRDAIKRLSLGGLGAVHPRRGTTITPVDVSDIVHITEVRADLEGLAAELAALRMSEEELAACREWVERLGGLDRRAGAESLIRMDTEIHRFTWRAAGNPYLAQTLDRYYALSSRVWYMVIDRVPGLAGAVHHQAKLLQALIDRDPPRARRAMGGDVLGFPREMPPAVNQ